MTSTLDLIKKRLHGSTDISNINVYTLSEPLKKKKKKELSKVINDSQWKVSISTEAEVQTFSDPSIFKSLTELSNELEKFRKSTSMSCYVTESFLTSSLQKCLCNKKYYSKDAVVSLIENDFITNGVKDVLCECLIKFNDIDVLRTLKPHQNIISERMMVHVIKDVIKKIPPADIKILLSDTQLEESIHSNGINDILFLLTLHVEEVQLQKYMKLFSTTEAAVLLQFLHFVLMHVSPAISQDIDVAFKAGENVTVKKVLCWLDCLVTTHLLSLTSSPSLRPLIKALQQTTYNQKSFYSNIKQIAPFVELLEKKSTLPEIPPNNQYSIETIIL